MGKGEKLNKRVWELFTKAGFYTEPNLNNGNEHQVQVSSKKVRSIDLYATDKDLGVSIIGSNKSGDIDTWTGHVNDFDEIKKAGKFSKLLFVITGKKLTEADLDYARQRNADVWTLDQLKYYEALVDTIGKYAKYEILHNLNIKTKEEDDSTNVLGLRVRQPTSESKCELYTFTLTPERLLKMCVVYRKALDVSGNSAKAYQRMVNKKRLPKIAEFIAQPDSILPVNIIVHLSDDVEITPLKMDDLKSTTGSKVKFTKNNTDLVRINIPMRYASLELVDGQHRLFGFSQSHYEELIKNYNLVVLGIRELTEANKTKTFVAINDNSRRMDANLVAFLKYTDDESICQRDNKLMAIKIVYELNKQHPFLNTIRLVDVGDQKITLKGFSGYDLQGLVGDRGYLRKYYLLNDSKEYISVLRMYFSLIKETFEVEWKDPNRYIISTNRGISAFLKLLKAILRHEGKQLDKSIIQKYMKALKSNWNNTWVTSDLKASYVGSQGWSNLYKDISTAIRKTIKDF